MITSSLTILANRRNNHFVEAADSDLNYGALSYIINTDENGNDYIEITACSAEAESVVIPNTIGGNRYYRSETVLLRTARFFLQ